jgi:hypothetical protein
LALAEQMEHMERMLTVPLGNDDHQVVPDPSTPDPTDDGRPTVDGEVSVSVCRNGPLKTTLRAKRTPGGRHVVRAA